MQIYTIAKSLNKRKELRKGGQKVIIEIWDKDNKVLKDKHDILNRIKEYYQDLYTKQVIDMDTINKYLKDVKCEMISSEYKDLCDDFISTNKILNTIRQLAKGKSPGRDGLIAEFYH